MPASVRPLRGAVARSVFSVRAPSVASTGDTAGGAGRPNDRSRKVRYSSTGNTTQPSAAGGCAAAGTIPVTQHTPIATITGARPMASS
jgi:hypothetical protein